MDVNVDDFITDDISMEDILGSHVAEEPQPEPEELAAETGIPEASDKEIEFTKYPPISEPTIDNPLGLPLTGYTPVQRVEIQLLEARIDLLEKRIEEYNSRSGHKI